VSAAWSPTGGTPPPPQVALSAIWDTGATNSVITENCIQRCGLAPTGMAQVHGVHGVQTVETFVVNIVLPNNVGFAGVTVTKGSIPGADMLIGMDIISRGDFAVTNVGGKTKFSFRTPSIAHIDYAQEATEINATNARGSQRANAKSRRAKYLR
jgi:hypothetical protein